MDIETKTETPVTTIRDVGQHEGQPVMIRGWLYNLRESGKLLFPIFRDGSGIIQGVVAKNAVSPELFDSIKGLTQESSVIVTGKVRADKRAPGGYELDVTDARVLAAGHPDDPYPISPKEHGVDFLMEHRHSVGALAAAGGRTAGSRRDHQGGARLFRRARFHAH